MCCGSTNNGDRMNSNTMNFLAWVVEDIDSIYAEIGSPREAQLLEFVEQGFLKQHKYGGASGEHAYSITNKWMCGSTGKAPDS